LNKILIKILLKIDKKNINNNYYIIEIYMSPLKISYNNNDIIEIGVDEVGRGPMFGRVYCAAVILPKGSGFKHELMKDSKKFHSKKKLIETAKYIKENCIAYAICYENENSVDKHNIKNATFMAMHSAIKELLSNIKDKDKYMVLVDGNDFKPATYFDNKTETIKEIASACIIGGDNLYTSIAAASILAKVERDNYIYEFCEKYPKLNEYYDLSNNKGYGTAKHMEGIRQHGITIWHRKSFGICSQATIINVT
jgi:ribonuclease HII